MTAALAWLQGGKLRALRAVGDGDAYGAATAGKARAGRSKAIAALRRAGGVRVIRQPDGAGAFDLTPIGAGWLADTANRKA